MAKKNNLDKCKIVGRDCPLFRVSYPALMEAKAFEDGEPSFGLIALIPKKDKVGLAKLRKAYDTALVDQHGPVSSWTKKQQANYDDPFRDGDVTEPDQEAYAGMIAIRFSAKQDKQPQVFDRDGSLADPKIVYPGCWAKATIIACPWEYGGKLGAKFVLKAVQKVRDDKQLGAGDASGDFDAVDDVEPEEENDSGNSESGDEDSEGGGDW